MSVERKLIFYLDITNYARFRSKFIKCSCKNCIHAHIKSCVEGGQVLQIKCPFCIKQLEDDEIQELLTLKSNN